MREVQNVFCNLDVDLLDYIVLISRNQLSQFSGALAVRFREGKSGNSSKNMRKLPVATCLQQLRSGPVTL